MTASIFISFASKDVKVATTLCAAIESRGFSCWISARDIQPGENFQVSIVQAIRRARIMLLVFTANSNTSEEMTKELALASQQKMIVIPLRIEDVTPNDAFAYEFATRQWIDVFSDWEQSIDQLCRRIGRALEGRAQVPTLVGETETVAQFEAEITQAAPGMAAPRVESPPTEIAAVEVAPVDTAEDVIEEEVEPVAPLLAAANDRPEPQPEHEQDVDALDEDPQARKPMLRRIALLAAVAAAIVAAIVVTPALLGGKPPAAPSQALAAAQPAPAVVAAQPILAPAVLAPVEPVVTEVKEPVRPKRKAAPKPVAAKAPEPEVDIPY